jgi:hypothetical protein
MDLRYAWEKGKENNIICKKTKERKAGLSEN